MKRNAIGLNVNINADGFDMAGGTTARKLTITGGDMVFTTTGTWTYTLPSANTSLAALSQIQTFTEKQTFQDILANGLAISTQADGVIASGDFLFSVTKNNSNTRTFSGVRVKPTLNTGGSNSNTTVNVLEVDTVNTSVTGLSVNLLRLAYGNTDRLKVTSAGSVILGSGLLSNSATDGFLYVNSTAGIPTGTPTSHTGRVPIDIDVSNGRFYGYYSSSWKNLGKDVYDVVLYGADPSGTNDSLSAFNAARDAAIASGRGGVVYIPTGIYKLSNTFQIGDGTSTTVSTYHAIRIVGAGGNRLNSSSTNDSVRLVWGGSAGGTVIKFAGPIGGCGIENVLIDCDGATNDAAVGIHVMHAEGFLCRNTQVLNNTGVAVDIDAYDSSTFTGQSVFNSGNTGIVENLFINSTQVSSVGVRLGNTGNIAQWLFLGGRWRLDGVSGSSSIILGYADHNTFHGVTTAAEVGLRIRPISGHPTFPVSNFFYSCSINGSTGANAVVIDNTNATWNPSSGYGMPFMFFPTADGASLPTDLKLFGLSDTKKFFGEFSFRDNATFEKKILGDFSNATHSSRSLLQSSTTNGASYVGIVPNGTSTFSGINIYSGSDPNNASYGSLYENGTFGTVLDSNKTGTGTSAPIYLQTSGNTGITVDAISATPNVVIGTAAAIATNAANGFLYVPTCAGVPTGSPSSYTGKSPIVIDTTNHRLYFNSGSTWRTYGTVTSVGMTVPSGFSVSGSPITSSGTLAVTFATGQTANSFLATPNGSTGALSIRTMVLADLPANVVDGYIQGLQVNRNSTTQLQVKSGAALIESTGKVLRLTSTANYTLTKITSTLNGAIDSSQTTITLASAASFPSAGTVINGTEQINYTGKSGNQLTGCTRGANGTTAASGSNGATITFAGWYYVYLYDNSGTPTVEIVSTIPSSEFSGTARSKTGDTTRRWIGACRLNTSGDIINFQTLGSGSLRKYQWLTDTTTSPFRILAGGTATSATNINASVVSCEYTKAIVLRMVNLSTNGGVLYADTSDTGTNATTSGFIGILQDADVVLEHPINSSRQLRYGWSGSITGPGAYMDSQGFIMEL